MIQVTRLFTFRAMGGDVQSSGRTFAELLDSGGGTFRSLDEYLRDGWRAIHWERDAGAGQHVQFFVVMERDATS
jgi:hypothetical protein